MGRNKFFTFVSLFGISFTLAVLIVVISMLDNILSPSYPEPYRDRTLYANRVNLTNEERNSSTTSAAGFYFLNEYVKKMDSPKNVGIISNGNSTNTFVNNRKLKLQLKYTDADIWNIFDYDFVEGKPYNEANISNNDYVAVITENTRDDYFGEGKKVVGQSIETDNIRYRVIGVVKNVPTLPQYPSADIFVPYNTSKNDLSRKDFVGGYVGVILAHSSGDFDKIKKEFQNVVDKVEIPADQERRIISAWLFSQKEIVSLGALRDGENEKAVTIFFSLLIGGMLLFMLLPTLNLININISRIMERASEIGVRKAFGATSSTLAIQFIVENIILTLLGGIIGLVLAFFALKFIENLDLIAYTSFTINYRVFIIAVLLCVVFGILSGVLPALRMSKMQVVNAIKESGK